MEAVETDNDNEQWQKTYSEWQGSVGVQRTDSNANQPYYPSWTLRTCSQTFTALCIYLEIITKFASCSLSVTQSVPN